MRKIKNFVLGGLQQKIFNLVVAAILLIEIAFMLVVSYQQGKLTGLIHDTNERQKSAIEETTDGIMEQVIDSTMMRSIELEGYIADNLFSEVENSVNTFAGHVQSVLENPDDYKPRRVVNPDVSEDGTVHVQLLFAAGVDVTDEAVAEKTELLGSLSDIMVSIRENDADIGSVFVGTPEGVLLIADDRISYKYGDDGKLMNFEVTKRPWYTGAVEKGSLYFTGLEADSFSDRVGVVCAVPVYVDGELAAVAGADLFLNDVAAAIDETAEEAGFSCMLDESGRIIFSPEKEGLFSVKQEGAELSETEHEELRMLLSDAAENGTEVRLVEVDGKDYYLAASPISTVGWSLLSVVDAEVLKQPSATLIDSYDEILEGAEEEFQKNSKQGNRWTRILLLIGSILALGGALTLAKRIVKPLELMTKKVAGLNGKNPLFKMDDSLRTGDEIEVLGDAFEEISLRTQEYIENIREITAEKERIGTELELATRIQADMLPNIFPPFPKRKDIDIYASMEPVKEVGGDFYDFFLMDDDHLGMVMADVSGKGVPAALFMMMTKILVNSITEMGDSPKETLERVNTLICQNNDEGMFVTVWLGILTISTGKIVAANAGHEYPIIRRANGQFEVYKDRHGFVIGGMENVKYREYEMTLEKGGTLFLYTDGVPEAMNTSKEMFGLDRMLEVLNRDPDADSQTLLTRMTEAVNEFAGEEPQFDDLTMLAVRI